MAFNDASADSQANTGARKLLLGVQAFEDLKNLVMVPGINANAVIGY